MSDSKKRFSKEERPWSTSKIASRHKGQHLSSSVLEAGNSESLRYQTQLQVHEALRSLILHNFSFASILREAGVSKDFLKIAFEDLDVDVQKTAGAANIAPSKYSLAKLNLPLTNGIQEEFVHDSTITDDKNARLRLEDTKRSPGEQQLAHAFKATFSECKEIVTSSPSALPGDDDFESLVGQVKSQVRESIHTLLSHNFSFASILKESGLNRIFLERSFKDIGLEIGSSSEIESNLQMWESLQLTQGSRMTASKSTHKMKKVERNGHHTSHEEVERRPAGKNIEFEMRLFSLRIQMEIRKISSLMNDEALQEQAKDELVQNKIVKQKLLIMNKLEELFYGVVGKYDTAKCSYKRSASNDLYDKLHVCEKLSRLDKQENHNQDIPIQNTEQNEGEGQSIVCHI